jgi:plastocyanin
VNRLRRSRVGTFVKASLLAALVLALVGCGSEDASEPDRSGGASLEVSETDFALEPSSLSVDEAGLVTIRVVNDGQVEHALEVEGDGVEEATETLAPRDSAELTVELAAGSYTMFCPIGNHRDQGMEGTVVVGGGAGGAGTGATTSDEDDDEGYGYGRG